MRWQQLRSLSLVLVAFGLLGAGWMTSLCSATMILPEDNGQPFTTLGALLANHGDVTVGDKHFTNFGYGPTGDMPAASGVNVFRIIDDAGNFGLRFQGAFLDVFPTAGGSDALITYDVAVTDPLFLISDAHLAGNPSRLGNGGSISVTETFHPLGLNGEYTMTIFDDANLATPKLADVTFFHPHVQSLHVQKDIIALALAPVTGANAAQTVTLSFVDQTYSQTKIPEPATIGLSLLGIVCMGRYLRRRNGQ